MVNRKKVPAAPATLQLEELVGVSSTGDFAPHPHIESLQDAATKVAEGPEAAQTVLPKPACGRSTSQGVA
jgi:hypothetical protein